MFSTLGCQNHLVCWVNQPVQPFLAPSCGAKPVLQRQEASHPHLGRSASVHRDKCLTDLSHSMGCIMKIRRHPFPAGGKKWNRYGSFSFRWRNNNKLKMWWFTLIFIPLPPACRRIYTSCIHMRKSGIGNWFHVLCLNFKSIPWIYRYTLREWILLTGHA